MPKVKANAEIVYNEWVELTAEGKEERRRHIRDVPEGHLFAADQAWCEVGTAVGALQPTMSDPLTRLRMADSDDDDDEVMADGGPGQAEANIPAHASTGHHRALVF